MKAPLLLSLLLVLGLAMPSAGQSRVQLLIDSEPEGALVKHNDEEIGVTGQVISLDRGRLPSSGNFHLQLLRTNYKPYHLVVPSNTLRMAGDQVVRFPQSAVPLVPENALVPLKENPAPLLVGFLVLAGVAGLVKRNRQLGRASQQREEQVQRLSDKITAQHDFAMLTIGRYRIMEQLGEGGIAKVYRAVPEDSLDESRAVALKILHPHLCNEKDHNQRFVREGTVSKNLIHPNIVRLYEIDSDNSMVYLVLELLQGETLREKLKQQGTFPVSAMKPLLRQVIDGLLYAHEMGVVHRDLTPANVMICSNGAVKLMDFGLARSVEVGHTITVTGVIQGTPGYMAPEQLTEELDARSDQYSLGVIMFEMLTGRRPIDRNDPMQLILATYSEDVPDPRNFQKDIPDPIAELILKLLRRNPQERFPSMKEAKTAFETAFATVGQGTLT